MSEDKVSGSADADMASSASTDETIRGLNEVLAREYNAVIQYAVFSSALKGQEYRVIAERLRKHPAQERAHALVVARQIEYLGGEPTVKGKEAELSNDSKEKLGIDPRDELKTIKSYRERIRQAERAGGFALPEVTKDITTEDQGDEISPRDAIGLRSRPNRTTHASGGDVMRGSDFDLAAEDVVRGEV